MWIPLCRKVCTYTEPLFKKLKILIIDELRVLKSFYKLKNKLVPEQFNQFMNIFNHKQDTSILRQIKLLSGKHCHSFATKCLIYDIPKILNHRKNHIRSLVTLII